MRNFAGAKGVTRSFLLALLLLNTFPVKAQDVYTRLKKAEHLQCFTEVSRALVCQCGCSFTLNVCPHAECPWGIPARQLIEERIQTGYSSEQIVHGFIEGFSASLQSQNAEYAEKLLKGGREDLLNDLAKGYGRKISAYNSLLVPLLFVLSTFAAAVFLLIYWFRRNKSEKTS